MMQIAASVYVSSIVLAVIFVAKYSLIDFFKHLHCSVCIRISTGYFCDPCISICTKSKYSIVLHCFIRYVFVQL